MAAIAATSSGGSKPRLDAGDDEGWEAVEAGEHDEVCSCRRLWRHEPGQRFTRRGSSSDEGVGSWTIWAPMRDDRDAFENVDDHAEE